MKTWIWIALLSLGLAAEPIAISDREAQDAGKKVWANECGQRIDGLTSWNQGEDFASLGIGHFLWYYQGGEGPFEESFPGLLRYLQEQGVQLPGWLQSFPPCPWRSRAEFQADFHSPKMTELRQLLANTVAHQARYIARRMESSLPKMLESAPKEQHDEIRRRFYAVLQSQGGLYPLLDYVNFKGEGVKASERYRGQGWGLLQVLQEMDAQKLKLHPTRAFAEAAERVLTRRVENSPPERGEKRWLTGWTRRVRGYAP